MSHPSLASTWSVLKDSHVSPEYGMEHCNYDSRHGNCACRGSNFIVCLVFYTMFYINYNTLQFYFIANIIQYWSHYKLDILQ